MLACSWGEKINTATGISRHPLWIKRKQEAGKKKKRNYDAQAGKNSRTAKPNALPPAQQKSSVISAWGK